MNKNLQKPDSEIGPPEEVIVKFLEIQELEIGARNHENELKKQQDSNLFAYSMRALEAQQTDREHERGWLSNMLKDALSFGKFISILITAIVIAALYFSKEQFIYECIKVLAPLIIGWIGGSAWQSKKSDKSEQASFKQSE